MKNSREKDYIHKILNKDERLLLSKILDRYHRFQKTHVSESSDFLNIAEKNLVENFLKYMGFPYEVYIPNEHCERFIIYFGEFEDFVSFYQISISSIRHKDVLGSLFSIGFTSSMIGDIFVLEDMVYFTNLSRYNSLLESSFTEIGHHKIQLKRLDTLPVVSREFQDYWISVSSMRFDLIVSKLCHMSRRQAESYLKDKRVFVNYQIVSRIYFLKVGDILSLEGYGKFRIFNIQNLQNGKLRVCVQKYC